MRIYKHGGEIRKPTFDKPKVYQRTRMFPGLEVTRSFGDLLGHHIGVSSEPDVIVHDIKGEDLFMTIATESVWDALKPALLKENNVADTAVEPCADANESAAETQAMLSDAGAASDPVVNGSFGSVRCEDKPATAPRSTAFHNIPVKSASVKFLAIK